MSTRSRGTQPARGPRRVAVLYTTAPGAAALPAKVREAEDLGATARSVRKALRAAGHEVLCVPFGKDISRLASRLQGWRADVVFNLAESPLGAYEKEPHAAAVLELLGLPYTGNGPLPLVLCKNKARTKQLLRAQGIATPRFCVYESVPRSAASLTFPVMVKPLRQDGSLGITENSVAYTNAQLRRVVADVLATQRQEAIAEEFLSGREFNVSVLGNGTKDAPYQVLPPGEYVYHSPRWRVCTFDAKWDEQHPSYDAVEAVCPAKLTPRLRCRLEQMTLACARLFELAGYARLDFRLDGRGQPQVFDINPNPDITPRMGIARSADSIGLRYPDFLDELVWFGLTKGPR